MNTYYKPNHAQLSAAVKGHDPRHRIRLKRSPVRVVRYAILIAALVVIAVLVLFVIAEVIVK